MAVFTVFCVPETKGKTLQDIQTMFGELEVKQARIGTISADVEQKQCPENVIYRSMKYYQNKHSEQIKINIEVTRQNKHKRSMLLT